MRKVSPMKTPTKTSLALFGGAAALVIAAGGGIAAASTTTTATGPTTPSVSVAPEAPAVPVVQNNVPAPAGSGVHIATLVGCIGGLNC